MKRIFWHDFIKKYPASYRLMQIALSFGGFRLELTFDKHNECHDAFIVKK